MINYELTHHAEDALAKRDIEVRWLKQALECPERIEPDATDLSLEHRLAAISEFENRVLRVIINPSTAPVRVITLFFDRSMRGEL